MVARYIAWTLGEGKEKGQLNEKIAPLRESKCKIVDILKMRSLWFFSLKDIKYETKRFSVSKESIKGETQIMIADRNFGGHEIDLRTYIEIIVKRKRMIISIFFVATFTVAIINFLIPEIYQATAIVKIGTIPGKAYPIYLTFSEKQERVTIHLTLPIVQRKEELKLLILSENF